MQIDFFHNEERIANWSSTREHIGGPGMPVPDEEPISVPRRGDHVIVEGVQYRVDVVAWCTYSWVQINLEEAE